MDTRLPSCLAPRRSVCQRVNVFRVVCNLLDACNTAKKTTEGKQLAGVHCPFFGIVTICCFFVLFRPSIDLTVGHCVLSVFDSAPFVLYYISCVLLYNGFCI